MNSNNLVLTLEELSALLRSFTGEDILDDDSGYSDEFLFDLLFKLLEYRSILLNFPEVSH